MDARNTQILQFLKQCSDVRHMETLAKKKTKVVVSRVHYTDAATLAQFCSRDAWPFRVEMHSSEIAIPHDFMNVCVYPETTWIDPVMCPIFLAANQVFSLGSVEVLYAIETGSTMYPTCVRIDGVKEIQDIVTEVFETSIATDHIRNSNLSFDRPVVLYTAKATAYNTSLLHSKSPIKMFGKVWETNPHNKRLCVAEATTVAEQAADEKWEVVSEKSEKSETTATATTAATVDTVVSPPLPPLPPAKLVAPTTDAEKLKLWFAMGSAMMNLVDGDVVHLPCGVEKGDNALIKAVLVGTPEWKDTIGTLTFRFLNAPMITATIQGQASLPSGRPALLPTHCTHDATIMAESRGVKVSVKETPLFLAPGSKLTIEADGPPANAATSVVTPLDLVRCRAQTTVDVFKLQHGSIVYIRVGKALETNVLVKAQLTEDVEWSTPHLDSSVGGTVCVRLVDAPNITIKVKFWANFVSVEHQRLFPTASFDVALLLAQSRGLVIGTKADLVVPESVISITPP